MIVKSKRYFRLLISALASSTMKAFGFQFGFDSCIIQLIASMHLDMLFYLFRDVIMYAIKQPFLHLSNTINAYNGNCYEHKQLSTFVKYNDHVS